MNKRLLFWLCLLVLSSSLTSGALPAGRVALVIGNANYPDARTPLSTTTKDARTLAENEFRRIDFDVDFKENLNKQNMQNAIAAFTGSSPTARLRFSTSADFGLMLGDRPSARFPVYTGMTRTQGIITVKAALGMLGLPGGPVRLPLADATGRDRAAAHGPRGWRCEAQ